MNTNELIVSNEIVQLYEKVRFGGFPQSEFLPFTENIVIIRDTEAKVSFWHGGVEVFHGATFNDAYGYMTSYDNAVKFSKESQGDYKIDEKSTLEVKIHLSVIERPLTVNKESSHYDKYLDIPEEKVWLANVVDIEQLKDNYNQLTKDKNYEEAFALISPYLLSTKILVNKSEVWNSKEGELPTLKEINAYYGKSEPKKIKNK